MNTDQLKGVIAVVEEGSVSRAAKRLYVSQPNLSSSISALEREVGFRIFERSNQGMELTELGTSLVRYARSILNFSEDIMALSENGAGSCRFHLLSPRFATVNRAFVRFCEAHKDDSRIDISKRQASVDATVQMIYRNLADYGLVIIDEHRVGDLETLCRNRDIRLERLGELGMTVEFAGDHPLNGEEDFFKAGPNYAIIGAPDYPDPDSFTETIRHFDGLSPEHVLEKKILVDDWDVRRELQSLGVGYIVGAPSSPETLAEWKLVSRPLGDIRYALCSLVSAGKKKDRTIREFEKLLGEEMKAAT
jgi:DNA-binding transcriptional LysR family regulator